MQFMTNRSVAKAQPILGQRAEEIQLYGTLASLPLGLSDETRRASVTALNQLLADSICLRDMYKKHHWQAAGATFYQLHLLFDKHADEQSQIVDSLAERVQMLGGVSIAMAGDVAQLSQLAMPPRGREEVPVQVSRMLEAHEHILLAARAAARACTQVGDEGTSDLLISEVVRKNELQAWFLSELVVDMPLVGRDARAALGSS
jgi:starvation-inducible DNA-binding protein